MKVTQKKMQSVKKDVERLEYFNQYIECSGNAKLLRLEFNYSVID